MSRYLPWLSLATGIGSALLMNRTPGRAWLVVVASLLCWLLLFALHFVERSVVMGKSSQGARFALLLGSQVAVQTAVFFPLPFYVRAASATSGHAVFFLAYALVVVVALWDPWYAKARARGWSAFCVHAFAAFVGLNMVLPVLGMSNHASLLLAGAITAVGVPLLFLAATPGSSTRWLALPAGALVILAALLGAPLVPPAPLELGAIAIGSRVSDKELLDAAPLHDRFTNLVCHSAIKAPLGLHDALVHVWRVDDRPLDEIALAVSGGRTGGFRTWSIKRPPADGWPPGHYSCRVQTASGQVVGVASVRVPADAQRRTTVAP